MDKELKSKSILSGAKLVGAGSLLSALSTYTFLIIVGRQLGVSAYGEFSAFWGAFFLLAGLLGAIDLEAARQSANNLDRTARIQKSLLLSAIYLGLIGTVAWIILAKVSFDGDLKITFAGLLGIWLVVPLGLTRGSLIGAGQAKSYGVIIAGEGILRLALVAVIVLSGAGSTVMFSLITVLGLAIWIPWVKEIFPLQSNSDVRESLRNLGTLIFAGAGSALLLSGLPWIISLNHDVSVAEVGILMTAVTLARVPLLAFSVVQALLIPYFVGQLNESQVQKRTGKRKLVAFVMFAATSVFVTSLIGPPAISLIFGKDFIVSGLQLGVLVASSWLLVVHMTLVSRLIAHNKHKFAAYSWLIGALIGAVLVITISSNTLEIAVSVLVASAVCALASSIFNFQNSSTVREG